MTKKNKQNTVDKKRWLFSRRHSYTACAFLVNELAGRLNDPMQLRRFFREYLLGKLKSLYVGSDQLPRNTIQ
jgi:hypothetical protein